MTIPIVTRFQLGWLAGILDGEGCITVTKQRPGSGRRKNSSYRLYVKVTMCDEPTIRHIHALVGVGAVTSSKSGDWSRAWTWWVASRQAAVIVRTLRPHLITKAIEADLALEWDALALAPRGGKGGGREVPPDLLATRERLFLALRRAKPSARFRAVS